MGRWSRTLAPLLVRFAGVRDGDSVLDVGSGTGALTAAVMTVAPSSRIVGIDPSAPYVSRARSQHEGARISFEVGDAQQMRFEPASFDRVLSLLVVNFIPDARKALGGMKRVTKPKGTIAAAVWDYGDGMEMLRVFWDEAVALHPASVPRSTISGRRSSSGRGRPALMRRRLPAPNATRFGCAYGNGCWATVPTKRSRYTRAPGRYGVLSARSQDQDSIRSRRRKMVPGATMYRPALAATTAVAVVLIAGRPVAEDRAVIELQRPDRAQAAIAAGVARLYDTSKLHRVDVQIPPADAEHLIQRTLTRMRATVTIDGVRLENVGVRQSGGSYHAYQPITNKPSLSLKFDEFVKDQELFGLDKLILKNEQQDTTFLSEHLTYEVFRRAGLAAPLTAYAQVTLNGLDSGIYVMREPVNKQFLTRNFGSDFKNGNLYEIETTDFVYNPLWPTLDDEGVTGRTRDDLVALANAVQSSTPDTFIATVGPRVDLDRLVTFVAVETATVHWDGFSGNNNNTYIYAHPKDGRFILLPWGADQTLGLGVRGFRRGNGPRSSLVQRLMSVPALAERLQSEIARVSREPVWDLARLLARIEQVATNLDAVESPSGRTANDIARFRSSRRTAEAAIK